ncbi:MAG TPA: carboxyl-terminal protease [Ruminococcus sp.]|nr:carboxyl-terminal protease [Ruminococcus sp.]HCR73758.1 carboxyl-terminal protease [Ruminococcus sp.]
MKRKVSIPTALLLAFCASAVTFSVTVSVMKNKLSDDSEMYSLLHEAEKYVTRGFYQDIDEKSVADGVIAGYMSGLDDKYARYQTPSEYKATSASDSGHVSGIGITINRSDDGYIKVVDFSEQSAARDAGIQIDDIITAVDGNDVVQTGYNETIDIIRQGDSGSSVVLTVKRNGMTFDIPVKRVEMDIITADGQMIENTNIGYIHIRSFNSTTAEQMNDTLERLLDSGAKSIIFDVRENPGGMVSSVEQCIDPFLPEGDIAIATYHNGETEVICHSDENELDIPIMILINEHSASGAELFSASLRDFGKAELVGINSFGKGIMQTTHTLSNGGAVTFTVATYQTVKSECYHGIGLAPDYEVHSDENDDITAVDPSKDSQLKKAVELLGG